MNNGVNLSAVLIADFMGMLLMLSLFIGLYWQIVDSRNKNKYMMQIVMLVFLSCGADAAANYFEGKPGVVSFILVYATNLWLFLSNMIMGPLWISLVRNHARMKSSKRNSTFVAVVCVIGAMLLGANFFVPLVFSIDAQNKYARGPFFIVFLIMEFVFITDGLVFYLRARKEGKIQRFFPVWQFIIPISFGIIIQAMWYGISAIWPCMSISICGIAISLQNETVFIDNLTGIYNRFYLDYWKHRIGNNKNSQATAMMLDMNGFKKINDVYGHEEGDEALKTCAKILSRTVADSGSVIRYAGDEFVIILSSQDKQFVETTVDEIKEAFAEYNNEAKKPYKLEISLGYCSVNLADSTFDEIMNEVDKRMYDDKKRFYTAHDRRSERK